MYTVQENTSALVVEIVYDFIQSYLDEHGYPPSHLEILASCAIDRTTLARTLAKLELQGRIQQRLGKPRALVLIQSA